MRQIAIFIAVGTAAAFTHLSVVAATVELFGLQPLAANVIGFCIGFLVSFGGHARWTFPLARERYAAARARFFAVALTGFVLNQTAYAEALHLFGPSYYLPALAAVLIGVAISTFLLSKLWAFAQPQG
ncbi:MAG: GtrA family protein [Rhodomicrobium sp.]